MTTSVVDLVVSNRMTYRKKLASFIRRTTNVPKEVLPYMPALSLLQNPMISVTGGPTDRKRGRSKSYDNTFSFGVRNIVLYSSPSNEKWLPENAEDMLDKLEHEVSMALLLADMQSEANGWASISRQGNSLFDLVQDSGVKWLTETIPVVMRVDDEQAT